MDQDAPAPAPGAGTEPGAGSGNSSPTSIINEVRELRKESKATGTCIEAMATDIKEMKDAMKIIAAHFQAQPAAAA
jgi:hypothetical protein